ncbi:MAG: hypothetical protein ACTHN5_12975 [Phycisphaerae bacterium]
MKRDAELDRLRKAQRRLTARLAEVERRIQHHLNTRPPDPFLDLVHAHSLHPLTPLPHIYHPASPPQSASTLPPTQPLCFQI